MRVKHLRLFAALAAATSMAGVSTSSLAQTADDFKGLNTTLTNMGYSPTLNQQSVTFKSAQGYFHGFVACGGGKIDAYVYGVVFPKTNLQAKVMEAALTYNDSHVTYFSLSTRDATNYAFILNTCFDPDKVSPAYLQNVVGLLESAAGGTHNIWDPTQWK